MTALRSSRLVGYVSILLAGMMIMTLAPAGILSQAEAQGQDRLLLLFPVTDASETLHQGVGARMTDYLQMALNEVEGVRVTEFSRTSPMVMRAVEEGRIRAVDVEADVTDAVTAIQMGYALDADEVCLATVVSIDTTEDPMEVEVLLNGQCYDVRANVDPVTMQVAERPQPTSTFGVSGTSMVREGYAGAVDPLLREALRDAAGAAGSVLAGTPAEEAVQQVEKKRDKSWQWILAAVVVVGLTALITGSDDGGDDGPGEGTVPPQPLRVEVEPSAIELFWAPPNTNLTLLRYDLQRSTDNGATWNPVPGSQGNVLADDTVFADFDVQQGVSYRYRIRAQYTTTGPSDWAEFRSILFPG